MAVETQNDEADMTGKVDQIDDDTYWNFNAIFANWRFLAAMAWRGFQAQGCGAIVISVGEACADVAYVGGMLPASYAALVECYDPRKQIVAVVRYPNSEQIYLLNGWPSPEECARAAVTPLKDANVHCVPKERWPQ